VLPAALAPAGATGYVTGSLAGQLQFRDQVSSHLPVIIVVVKMLALGLGASILIDARSSACSSSRPPCSSSAAATGGPRNGRTASCPAWTRGLRPGAGRPGGPDSGTCPGER
jgi:hypothetical protein